MKAIVLLAVLLAGCGSAATPTDGGADTGTDAGVVDLTGHWLGVWNDADGNGGELTLEILQAGDSLSGDVAFADSWCYAKGTVQGFFTNGAYQGGFVFGSSPDVLLMTVSGTLAGGELSGTWSNSTGSVPCCYCPADSGTWRVSGPT